MSIIALMSSQPVGRSPSWLRYGTSSRRLSGASPGCTAATSTAHSFCGVPPSSAAYTPALCPGCPAARTVHV